MADIEQRSEERFGLLADAMLDSLLARVRSGAATAAELNVARQLLADSKIQIVPSNKKAQSLARDLPFGDDDDRNTLPFPKAQ